MIYIKRILWLLCYPIVWLLACALFVFALFFIGFECVFRYIKNGNIENGGDCLEWCYNLIELYRDLEPKENNKI